MAINKARKMNECLGKLPRKHAILRFSIQFKVL